MWVRATPTEDEDGNKRTVVLLGGLARTDQAGYGEEFGRIARDLLEPEPDEVRRDVAAGRES